MLGYNLYCQTRLCFWFLTMWVTLSIKMLLVRKTFYSQWNINRVIFVSIAFPNSAYSWTGNVTVGNFCDLSNVDLDTVRTRKPRPPKQTDYVAFYEISSRFQYHHVSWQQQKEPGYFFFSILMIQSWNKITIIFPRPEMQDPYQKLRFPISSSKDFLVSGPAFLFSASKLFWQKHYNWNIYIWISDKK